MGWLRRFPARRPELVGCLLILLGALAGVWALRGQMDLARLLALFTLEMLLPLGMGLLAAGCLAGDPILDLLLSAHRPAWQVLLERLAFLLALSGLVGWLALRLCERWELPLPIRAEDRLFIWFSPLVFCLGLASAAALLRGRALDGGLSLMAWMGGALVTTPLITHHCTAASPGGACIWWLVNPLATLGGGLGQVWPFNRLLWLSLGVGLLTLSLYLAQREEALLSAAGAVEG
jgi:hypothetical protein